MHSEAHNYQFPLARIDKSTTYQLTSPEKVNTDGTCKHSDVFDVFISYDDLGYVMQCNGYHGSTIKAQFISCHNLSFSAPVQKVAI